MKKYDLSVIIPVYNREHSIIKCINSIIRNDSNIEIILVDDGSIDNTKKILRQIKNNRNIKLIDLDKNGGVSKARNAGLKDIKGKYFTFVDSDDYMEERALDKLLQKAYKYDLDICGCNYVEVSNKKVKCKYIYEDKIYNHDELIDKALHDDISLIACTKLFKSQTYKDKRFNEQLKINEDYLFTLECILESNKAAFINDYLYNNVKSNDTLTYSYNCNEIKENNYLKYLNIDEYESSEYFKNIYELHNLHRYSMCKDKENRYKYIKENVNGERIKNLLGTNISKFLKIEIIIYLISIRIHLLLFPLYFKIRNKIRR